MIADALAWKMALQSAAATPVVAAAEEAKAVGTLAWRRALHEAEAKARGADDW